MQNKNSMGFNPEALYRFFKGQYSRKDFLSVKSAFEDADQHQNLRECLEKQWNDLDAEQSSTPNADHILRKIRNQIAIEDKPIKKNTFIVVFQRIAAILIVPLIVSFFAAFYFQGKTNSQVSFAEIQCPVGAQTKFTLPDGTTGFLNSGSTLIYPVVFSKNRSVTLRGEAFFDVVHDKKHPFFVNTPKLRTKVLGTQFNVIAYENESSEEVILKNGKVEVYSQKGKKLDILAPNQQLTLNTQASTYHIKNVDSEQYSSWTEGKLVFRNESMQQVSKRLGRRYNIEIEIRDPELLNYAFRATFIDEPVEEVLKLLAKTAPMKYEEQKREVSTDNAYNKRKFVISLDKKRLHLF